MGSKITGKEYQLSKIFSKEFEYYIPAYQRPYAWTEEQTEKLFDDLYNFYLTEQNDNYFLGSIVLIKEDEIPKADVIDGQQRLTTLTIFVSVIASMLTGDIRKSCDNYLREPGNILEGLEPKPRLHLRQKDQDFFNKYIQNVKISDLLELDLQSIQNESQQHIKDNSRLLVNKMKENFGTDENKIADFCRFLVTRCYLVAVYTPSQQSAFRVFSVMNSRGLPLLPIDIIKSDIIGQIPESEQQHYTDKWEELEVNTGRAGFNDVFGHTRMIFAKTKAKQNLLEEFKTEVLSKVKPKELIDDILEPYAEAYNVLVKKKYVSESNAEKINHYLFWLNKVDNSDWMPTAIKFMADRKNESSYILWFFSKLERLTSYLFVTAKDVNKRIERYSRILVEMEQNPDHSINDPLSSVELTNEEKKEFISVLDGEIYKLTAVRRNYVILRLNDFVGDGATGFDFEPSVLTIEHVLPQTVDPSSEWASKWPDNLVRAEWLNRIANLLPLTRKKNSEAQNYDFNKKKEVYFKGKNGTSTYPLTTQVLGTTEWTVEVVKARQEKLLNAFSEKWDLKYVDEKDKDNEGIEDTASFFIKNKRGANAEGYKTEDGFVVLANSKLSDEIVPKFEENYPNAYVLRNSLINDGKVINGILQEDYLFTSISLAASVILGRNAQGQKEWVDSLGFQYDQSPINANSSDEFDINDESTYGNITVGKLAYELIKHVIESGNVTDEEIESLKKKDGVSTEINSSGYPILANNREDNKGGSNVTRYRKEPVKYKGVDIYVSFQWKAIDKSKLVAWYKKHQG